MAKGEVDVPLTYADYYYLEAMQRYLKSKKQVANENFCLYLQGITKIPSYQL